MSSFSHVNIRLTGNVRKLFLSSEVPLYAKQLLELIWDTEDKSKDECNQERNQGACSQENPNQDILETPLQLQIAEEKQTKPGEANKLGKEPIPMNGCLGSRVISALTRHSNR